MQKKKRKKRKPRKPNLKNPNSRTWKKKADNAWKEQVHATGYCEKCEADGVTSSHKRLNAHHIIVCTRLRYRHDLSNGILLCTWHHKFDPTFAPHADSFSNQKFLDWLEQERPGQFQWYEENKDNMRQMEGTYQDKYEELTK